MWVAESKYDILGGRFTVRTDVSEVAEEVERLLSPFKASPQHRVRSKESFALVRQRSGDEPHHVYRGSNPVGRSGSWTRVLDLFLGELNRLAIDEMDSFGVHAGVVASGNRTLAFPGGSGSGKSTLVAACLRAGLEYVSDEALCLDYGTGSVIPYPKPLSLSGWALRMLKVDASQIDPVADVSKAPIHPDALGGVIASSPRDVTDLVRFERQPGPPSIRELPSSQVVATLLGYSFNHYKRPADAFALATNLARRCQAWALSYEDPVEAAGLLNSTLN